MEIGGLKNLIGLGAKPRKGIPGVILAHFSEIAEARELGWTWRDIAMALGRSGDEKAMSTAFWRIKKRIDAGKLKLSPSGTVPGAKGPPSPTRAIGNSPPKKIFTKIGEKQKEETEKSDLDFFNSLPQI